MTSQELLKLKLPDSPGVYTFKDSKGRPHYIGRATSLRDRTKSYFSTDLIETRGPRIIDMVTKSANIVWQETDSVLEAIILESQLIKRYQPHYNVDDRDDKSSQYIIITAEPWPRVFLARARDFDLAVKEGTLPYKVKKAFGPYPHGGLIKEALKIIRKLFPFKDKKSFDSRHEAFYRAIGRSPHETDENARRRYKRTIENLILFFEGKKQLIRKRLEASMKSAAKLRAFEEAGYYKRLLYALDHINDMALLKHAPQFDTVPADGSLGTQGTSATRRTFRIEAYDVAHMAGQHVVGVMVASFDGQLVPSEYRKFKITKQVNDDIAGLMEILSRRLNHSEWTYPDLIVVDGNEVHASHAEGVLKARRIEIPVVAVTKDERHTASRLIGHPDIIKKYQKEIVALNAEAHRFAIRYHRSKRRIV
jgi:excinuclease ABC subunit C